MPEENPTSESIPDEVGPGYLTQVAVRALVEWALKQGSLGGARRFVGPSRALQGTREHQRVQDARPPEYQREAPVQRREWVGVHPVTINGRIDGLWPREDGWLIEEIKSVTPDWDGEADPLHWAQLRVYGYLVAQEKGLATLDLQLTYARLDSGDLTVFREPATAEALEAFYQSVWRPMAQRLEAELAWRAVRNTSLRDLPFPFPQARPGQEAMITAIEGAIHRQGRVFVEAPTGIGKTISALLAAVRALGAGRVERIVYLTAKTSGRALAEEACDRLRERGGHLKTLTLNAATALCFTEAPRCDLRECPYAIGYYDRYRDAIAEALTIDRWDRAHLEAIAKRAQVCPFALSRDLIDFADVVIADYNHAFDPTAAAARLIGPESRRPLALLVDEAHNLVDRSRSMFSAQLLEAPLRAGAQAARSSASRVARALEKVAKSLPEAPSENPEPLQAALPSALTEAIRRAVEALESWLTRQEPSALFETLLTLFFQLLDFQRATDRVNARYAVTLTRDPDGRALRIHCLDASTEIRQTLEFAVGSAFFSATLSPARYFTRLLGGTENDPWLRLDSPFPTSALTLFVHDRIDTRYRARESSLDAVVTSLKKHIQARRGNHLVFLPSYEYLAQIREALTPDAHGPEILCQEPNMSLEAREAFLAAFTESANPPRLALATLGGVFGEGVDLAGDRLIAVTVVGVGLPRVGIERELLRAYYEETYGEGFAYAYQIPGMNRVIQAVGRLIRTPTDRGAALLMDTRFHREEYRRLFPPWWRPIWASERQARGG